MKPVQQTCPHNWLFSEISKPVLFRATHTVRGRQHNLSAVSVFSGSVGTQLRTGEKLCKHLSVQGISMLYVKFHFNWLTIVEDSKDCEMVTCETLCTMLTII